jgi:hypothetical protein
MPPPQGSRAQDTSKDGGPQGSAVGVAHDVGTPVPETGPAMDATADGGSAATTDPVARLFFSLLQMGAVATLPDDDDMFEVIMGRPCL